MTPKKKSDKMRMQDFPAGELVCCLQQAGVKTILYLKRIEGYNQMQ